MNDWQVHFEWCRDVASRIMVRRGDPITGLWLRQYTQFRMWYLPRMEQKLVDHLHGMNGTNIKELAIACRFSQQMTSSLLGLLATKRVVSVRRERKLSFPELVDPFLIAGLDLNAARLTKQAIRWPTDEQFRWYMSEFMVPPVTGREKLQAEIRAQESRLKAMKREYAGL